MIQALVYRSHELSNLSIEDILATQIFIENYKKEILSLEVKL